MVTGYTRGHKINWIKNEWVYADDKTTMTVERPCIKCNLIAGEDGYDPCMGFVKDATSVCCGHGIEQGSIMYEDKSVKRLPILQ